MEHRLSEEERECPICGETMTEIGKEVRRTLKIVPAQVSIREDWYYTYACRRCQNEGTETPVVKAEKAPAVISGSFASPEAAEAFLKGFTGYLHADGYQGYHKLPENIRVVGCWAHARRKFDKALNAIPPDKREGSAALTGLQYCNELFAWEKRFEALDPEEWYAQRLEREKPVLDAWSSWADSISGSVAPKSALGKALYYLREQWPYLIRYLEDGRLELSNNRAERSIKPFVIGRKNFLFANSPLGAQSSAVVYSLIETAKENGLDPYQYLYWLLTEAPVQVKLNENRMKELLPFR